MSNYLSRYIASVFVIVVIAVWWNQSVVYNHNKEESRTEQANVIEAISQEKNSKVLKEFPNINISGKSAIVYDFGTEKSLYQKSSEAQLPLASITKVMTVYSAMSRLVPDANITITQNSFNTEGEFGLLVGDVWTLEEISKFTLVNSANDGAEAIAENVTNKVGKDFVTLMNLDAERLGLRRTYFINASGLDESETLPSGYGSASDVAKLMYNAYQSFPAVFQATTLSEYEAKSLTGLEYLAVNTNQFAPETSGLRLSKTGYTDIAGGNLGVLIEIEPTHYIAIVVLGSSREERFSDVQLLLNALIEFLS